METPKRPVLKETFDRVLGSTYQEGDVVPGHLCPECGGSVSVAKSSFNSKSEQKLVVVYYLKCTLVDHKDHGYSFRSKHCNRKYHNFKPRTDGKEVPPTPNDKVESEISGEELVDAKPVDGKPVEAKPIEGKDGKGNGEENPVDQHIRKIAKEEATEAVESKFKDNIEKIKKDISELTPKPVEHKWRDEAGEIKFESKEGDHPKLSLLLELYNAGVRNFFIVGPAGSGKTTLGMNFADALKRTYSIGVCSYTQEREEWVGRVDLLNGGKYLPTDFVEKFKSDGVCIIDEMDNGNANTMASINTGLANNKLSTPGGIIERHKDNVVIAIGNTYGNGPSRQYVGRNQLDAATLDRFMTVTIDFDPVFEKKITGADNGTMSCLARIRENANKRGIRRVVGTRFLQRALVIMKTKENMRPDQSFSILVGPQFENWTKEEKEMSGIQ